MIKKIKDLYKESSYEIQQKAPILFIVLILLLGLSFLILLSDFLSHGVIIDYIEHSLLTLITLAAIWMLLKGHYSLVCNIYFSLAAFMLALLQFLDPARGDLVLPFYIAILGSFLIFSSIFIRNMTLLKFLSAFFVLGFLAIILRTQLEGNWQNDRMPIANQIIYSTIALTSIIVSLLMTRNFFYKVISTTQTNMAELEKLSDKNQNLVLETADQLGKAGQLQMDTDSSLEISSHINEQTRALSKDVEKLNQLLGNSQQELNLVDKALGELHQFSEEQSGQVARSSASVEEMAASISHVSSIVKSRKESVEELKAQASSGEGTMNHTRESFQNTASLLDNIKSMTSVITGIAAQTNLLAMNAAIEAAHAGDSGRGFAVVAAEIRNLAESSSQSAKKIAESTQKMVQSIEATGLQVEESGRAFRNIAQGIDKVGLSMDEIYQSTAELDQGSREILETVSSLNEIAGKVKEQVNRVAESSGKVNTDLKEIRQFSTKTAQMADSSSTDAEKLQETARVMQKLCSELREQSLKLNAEMQQ